MRHITHLVLYTANTTCHIRHHTSDFALATYLLQDSTWLCIKPLAQAGKVHGPLNSPRTVLATSSLVHRTNAPHPSGEILALTLMPPLNAYPSRPLSLCTLVVRKTATTLMVPPVPMAWRSSLVTQARPLRIRRVMSPMTEMGHLVKGAQVTRVRSMKLLRAFALCGPIAEPAKLPAGLAPPPHTTDHRWYSMT